MSKKIIGATVGTPTSPKKIEDEIKPVKTVNGKEPDKNGNIEVEKPTYTAKDVGALPADTKIPSKTSELDNDSGFIMKTVSDLANYYLKSETLSKAEINALVSAIPKFAIEVVSSLPTTNISTTTVYLVKSGSGGDLYTEYIRVNNAWEVLGSQKVDLTGYAKLTDIPTKLSELDNDSGYITKAVSDLVNYYKKSEVYSKDEIDKKGFLTEHQDISGKLDANKLPEAVNAALAQAKESGEFDGEDGKSAYEYAKDGGYTGTEAEFAEMLAGDVLPDYWEDAVITAVNKVKALQNAGGNDVINFVWFSDLHYGGDKSYTGNIGKLCAKIMDGCNIPLTLMNGDTLTASACKSEDLVLSLLDTATDIYAPIGHDRLMLVSGNHEDVWGSHTANGSTVSFVNKVAPAKIWNKLYREQAMNFRRVFGGNGTYFYVDNTPQKVRFICLNSSYYDGDEITNGTVKIMSVGFGTEQLLWLENTALNVEDGWSVVLTMHIPPISEYSSQFSSTDYTDIRNIISSTKTDILGIFCGHMHKDVIIEGDLPCPICIITCAVNTPYDGTASERVAGTITETALDIVSINKATKQINMTRVGHGTDRSVGEDPNTDAVTNLFDKNKVLLNARYNSSRTVVAKDGMFITGRYAVPANFAANECYLYVKGISLTVDNSVKLGLSNSDSLAVPSIGDVIEPTALQFNLTTTLGAKWEMLDADSQYYKIDLRRNGAGNIHSYVSDIKAFDFTVYVGTTALNASDIPDFIMSFEPIE